MTDKEREQLIKNCSIEREVVALVKKEPFYAHFLQNMRRIVTFDCPTMGVNITDGLNLYINPKFFSSLTFPQRVAVLKHEVLHIVHKHLVRIEKHDHMVFNIASDMAINQFITPLNDHESSLICKLPDTAILPAKYGFKNGLTTEEYYKLLMKNAKFVSISRVQNKNQSGSDDGKEKDGSKGSDKNKKSDKKLQELTEEEKKSGELIDDHGVWGKGNSDKDFQEHIIKNHVKKALQHTKDYSHIPASLLNEIKDCLQHESVNWRAVLQFFLHRATIINNAPTRKKPNRRFGYYFDGSKVECKLNLCVAVDTSGSITEKDIALFFYEIEKIKALGMKITIIECDTRVQKVYEYKKRPKAVNGGGGTSFLPVFKYIKDKMKIKPDCLIYITDLYGELKFKNVANIPTLWAITLQGDDPKKVPFGMAIKLKDDGSDA